MSQPSEFQYRLYLVRKALSNPSYTFPAGVAVAGSILSYLIEPTLPLFGLIPTAAGMYIGLEAAVLRFPSDLRPRFRDWFFRYSRLCALNPEEKGIVLSGTHIDPNIILSSLIQMSKEKFISSMFQQYGSDIDREFTKTEQMIEEAKITRDKERLEQIRRGIHEDSQRMERSKDAYIDAMKSVYGERDPYMAETQDELNDAQNQGTIDSSSPNNSLSSPRWNSPKPSGNEDKQQIQRHDE